MLQKALNLVDEYLSVEISIEKSDLLDEWPQVVLFYLLRSREALASIKLVSEQNLHGPAIVLHRYIFELAVNIRYISNEVQYRLPEYLEHSHAHSPLEDIERVDEKLRDLWDQEDHSAITQLLVPARSWKNLKEMCDETGCMDQYLTMYRSASELAHGGGRGISLELLNLLREEPRPGYEFPGILLGATEYQGWVVQTGCKVFPNLEDVYKNMRANWAADIIALGSQVREAVRTEMAKRTSL